MQQLETQGRKGRRMGQMGVPVSPLNPSLKKTVLEACVYKYLPRIWGEPKLEKTYEPAPLPSAQDWECRDQSMCCAAGLKGGSCVEPGTNPSFVPVTKPGCLKQQLTS